MKQNRGKIGESQKGLTFDLNDKTKHINIIVGVEEFANGQLIISAKYGTQTIGRIVTSIDGYKFAVDA